MMVGVFVEHMAGVLNDDGADPAEVFRQRAREAAAFIEGNRPPD
jgi:hypothetical protein